MEPTQNQRVTMRVPRWRMPIALEHVRQAAPPPTMFELLETNTAAVSEDLPGIVIGTGVGISGAPGVVREPRKPQEPRESGANTEPRPPRAVAPVAPAVAVAPLPENLAKLEARIKAVTERDRVLVHPEVFVPSNRRAFKQFIIQSYRRYALPKPSDIPDPDACKKAAESSKKEVKTFAYQSFVRDYIQRPSPYRGVLVYHGLGSGKTCTSIAAMEALNMSDKSKPVFVMTPASLNPNYKDEITKCGPFIFRTNNHWTFISIPNLKAPTPESELLLKTIGLPLHSIKKRKGGWLPDPAKPSNYDALSQDQRKQIQDQIYEHMDSRIQFINYNGLTEKTIRSWACETPNKFDGATVVVDEIHNLVRTINNSQLDQFYKDEPRTMAQYMPKFCAVGEKYRISYLLYRMMCNAVGMRLIALSATPIINFPQEIAILANLLAGDTRMVEVNIAGLERRDEILRALEKHPEVDFAEVLPRPDMSVSQVRITPVPSGCRKVLDANGAFRGFIRDERLAAAAPEVERERALEPWFQRVSDSFKTANLPSFGVPTFQTVSRLPDTEKEFREMFIDTENLVVKPRIRLPLMARLSGLISYYKGGKADLMAQVTKDEEVFVDMSDLQLKKYTDQRKSEIDKELKKSKNPPKQAAPGVTYTDVTKSVNSTFKIFSRAACNFVFPGDLERPQPADFRDVLRMIGARAGVASEEEGDGEVITADDAIPTDVPVEQPAAEEPTTYEAALVSAVATLRANAPAYFAEGALANISPKFQAMIDRIKTSRGPALVYSNFKTLEGVGLFGVALETQMNMRKFDIVPVDGVWDIAPETRTALPGTQFYIGYTGDEDRTKRKVLLDVFNGKWGKLPGNLAKQIKDMTGKENNLTGDVVKVFMITQSGAEGISLANVRQVHIMEPYWNYVRLDQVKGRAIRICSHMDLPPEERTVDVFTYIAQFSKKQLENRMVIETLMNFDAGETTDQSILRLLKAKKKLADSILDTMKQSAVDCELNATENGTLACYRFAGVPSMEPLFHPLVDVHVNEAEAAIRAAV